MTDGNDAYRQERQVRHDDGEHGVTDDCTARRNGRGFASAVPLKFVVDALGALGGRGRPPSPPRARGVLEDHPHDRIHLAHLAVPEGEGLLRLGVAALAAEVRVRGDEDVDGQT